MTMEQKDQLNQDRSSTKLVIEWKHLDSDGETCDRCYDTGENLHAEIKRLQRKLEPRGIGIQLIETLLDETNVQESNEILMNGMLIEEIIDMEVRDNYCASCSDLVGSDTFCRTIIFDGEEYDEIPAKAIRRAVMKVLNLEEEPSQNAGVKGCGCGCGDGTCC
jgi:hypothetical protein